MIASDSGLLLHTE